MGLTLGLVSGWEVYKTHRDFSSQPYRKKAELWDRVHSRLPVLRRRMAITAIATAVAGYRVGPDVDTYPWYPGGHREWTHSLPILESVTQILNQGCELLGTLADEIGAYFGEPELSNRIAEFFRAAQPVVKSGWRAGYATHLFGDIPGGNYGGFGSLRLFYPLDQRFNIIGLKPVASLASPYLLKAGLTSSAAAWATAIARLYVSDDTWHRYTDPVVAIAQRMRYRASQELVAGAMMAGFRARAVANRLAILAYGVEPVVRDVVASSVETVKSVGKSASATAGAAVEKVQGTATNVADATGKAAEHAAREAVDVARRTGEEVDAVNQRQAEMITSFADEAMGTELQVDGVKRYGLPAAMVLARVRDPDPLEPF